MKLLFRSRMKEEEILRVPDKKMHFNDGKYFLDGGFSKKRFLFEVGGVGKNDERFSRFVFSGTMVEEKARTAFDGELVKERKAKVADLIAGVCFASIMAVLALILGFLTFKNWLYALLFSAGFAGIGAIINTVSTRKETKGMTRFFADYMKKVFRADIETPEKKKK